MNNKACLGGSLKAGILPSVLMVCVVMALLSGALIGLAYYRNHLVRRDQLLLNLTRNAHSAMQYVLANPQLPTNALVQLDLFETGQDSVSIEKRDWGLFSVAVVSASRGPHRKMLSALIGARPDDWGRSTLYLVDENRPLSLAGNTQIKGTCYLPQAGVRAAYVEGGGFIGNMLIDGQVHKSALQLPALPQTLQRRLDNYSGPPAGTQSQAIALNNFPRQLTNSFTKATLIVRAPSEVSLRDCEWSGNIYIFCPGDLQIESTAHLEGVIVSARKVVIKAGFRGSIQAFAQDTLTVEEETTLKYPSVLSVYNKKGKCRLMMDKKSRLEGILLVGSSFQEGVSNSFTMAPGTTLEGQAYVDGLVELRGAVHGSLACRRFYLVTPSALYENHLLHAQLDVTRRSGYFLTSPLFTGSASGLVQWLP